MHYSMLSIAAITAIAMLSMVTVSIVGAYLFHLITESAHS